MRCEVVAIGTELLLGQIVDTNSSYIGEQLALSGIDSHFQTKVGDNLERIVAALRLALGRSDAVIVCGGLGPTQDDITRAALAEVMGVELVRDEALVDVISAMFSARGRRMAENNLLQADVPVGASIIEQTKGTAPGLICPVGEQVLYAVPGVPYEMKDMLERAILPDLRRRAGAVATIRSRTLRTWGDSESGLAERLGPRLDALDAAGNPTIAFLASGIEGIKVRVTAKGADAAACEALLDAEEAELRAIIGDQVFGVDDETMESAVGRLLVDAGVGLAVAESLTGGLVGARITAVPGASRWFRGGIVSYASALKFDLLDVPEGPVVSAAAAGAMAAGVARRLDADVGLSTTGVAGPDGQDGERPGTVFVGLHLDGETSAIRLQLPGDRDRVRQFSVISALDHLRHRLLERAGGSGIVIAPQTARRLWEALEPLHSSVYFAPEPQAALTEAGLKGFWMTYFASRSAAMGRVSAPVVEATFANFHPTMIGRAIPDAWALAEPDAVLAARLAGATGALRRLLGEPPTAAEAELLGDRLLDSLARADPLGRPLFSAHMALARPDDPTGLVWHAATVFREHRGDGHVAALTAEGINGVAAHVLAVGRGVTDRATQQGARRWSDDEWDAAVEHLRSRHLVDPAGNLTEHGRDLVLRIETITDRRSAEALDPYGPDLDAAIQCAEGLAKRVLAAGAVPFPNPMGYAKPSWAA